MFQHLIRLQTDRRFFDPATEAVRLSFTADEDGFATVAVFAHGTGHALSLGEFRIRAGPAAHKQAPRRGGSRL